MRKYSTVRVVVSFILLFMLPFMAIFAIAGIIASVDERKMDSYDYRDLYTIEVVGHSVEKISGNLCEITLSIKNDSAYTAELGEYDFNVKAGEKNVNDACLEAFDTNLGYHDQKLIVPAGRTVDAHFRVPVQNPLCSVTFSYRCTSYSYREFFGGEDYKYYLVEVDLT